MYDDVLVPTDGSEGSEQAVRAALEIVERFDATLHGLYVADVRGLAGEETAADVHEAVQERGRGALDDLADRAAAAGVDSVETVLAEGVPHRAILDYVDEADIDLVVMGTHGRTGVARYLLGSVTEKVVRTADVPVLTVPLAE